MKRYAIVLGCLLTVLLTGCQKKKGTSVLENLNPSDIKSVTVLALPPEKMVEVTDTSNINSILEALKEIPLLNKLGKDNQYNGQLIQFTLKKKKSDIVFSILSPFICIDDIWYETDDKLCEDLNVLANQLLMP